MAEPFLGEIRMTAFRYAPKGFALCNGQVLQISQYQALFAVLGKTFGGDGTSNFALPNFQGRTPVDAGNGFSMGQQGGEAAHALSTAEIPSHTHTAYGSSANASTQTPAGNLLASGVSLYGGASSLVPTGSSTITSVGTNQPHENRQPYQTISFCIALVGIYPSRP